MKLPSFKSSDPMLGMENLKVLLVYGSQELGESFIAGVNFIFPNLATSCTVFISQQNDRSNQCSQLYIKGKLFSDQITTLLPKWAFFCRGIFHTTLLPSASSKEQIYEEAQLENLRMKLDWSIREYLGYLSLKERPLFAAIMAVHGRALMKQALQDSTMHRLLFIHLEMETNLGVIPMSDYLKQSKEIRYVRSSDNYQSLLFKAGTIVNKPFIKARHEEEVDFLERANHLYGIRVLEFNSNSLFE